jgi:hypothetical protein
MAAFEAESIPQQQFSTTISNARLKMNAHADICSSDVTKSWQPKLITAHLETSPGESSQYPLIKLVLAQAVPQVRARLYLISITKQLAYVHMVIVVRYYW